MRLVVDAQVLQSGGRHRGIDRYATLFLRSMARRSTSVDLTLVLSGALPGTIEPVRAVFDDVLPQQKIVISPLAGDLRVASVGSDRTRLVYEKIQAEYFAALQPDVVLTMSTIETRSENVIPLLPSGGRGVAKVHASMLYDTIPLDLPRTYLQDPETEKFVKQQFDRLAASDALLAISEVSRASLLRHFPECDAKAVAIGVGLDGEHSAAMTAVSDPAWLRADVAAVIEDRAQYILCVGGGEPHKNVRNLLEAFAQSQAGRVNGFRLVLADPFAHLSATIDGESSRIGIPAERLVVLDRVSDEDLAELYAKATLTVCPSIVEGFCLTPFEAAMHGSSVIVAANPAMRELLPHPELWFDPFSVESLARKIDDALSDAEFRHSSIQLVNNRSREHRWSVVADRALIALDPALRAERATSNINANHVGAPRRLARFAREVAPPKESHHVIARAIAEVARSALSRDPREWVCYADVSSLYSRDAGTGIQRVSRNILAAMQAISADKGFRVQPVVGQVAEGVFVFRELRSFSPSRPLELDALGPEIRPQNGDAWLGLDLCFDTDSVSIAALRAVGVRTFFVVYDLLPVSLPGSFWAAGDSLQPTFLRWLSTVAQADGCICISETVARDLQRWFRESALVPSQSHPQRPFKLSWAHLSGDMDNAGTLSNPTGWEGTNSHLKPGGSLAANGSESRAALVNFLLVGTFEPRKGHAQVLAAFKQLWARGAQVRLTFVGRSGWSTERFMQSARKESALNPLFDLFESPTDEELERQYNAADGVIVASLGEGFGLPVVEAMSYRKPVLCRNLPVFREIGGKQVTYFDGESPVDLVRAIDDWRAKSMSGAVSPPDPWNRSWLQVAQDFLALMTDSRSSIAHMDSSHAGFKLLRRWESSVELTEDRNPGSASSRLQAEADAFNRAAFLLRETLTASNGSTKRGT